MLSPLRIDQRTVADVTVLELHGRLVVDEGDRFLREQITRAVASGRRQLLLDLRNVTSIDSGGVGALVAMYLHVLRRNGSLKLLCPSDRTCRVLRITHLLNVFEVFATEEEAIRSFAATSPVTTRVGDG